MIAAIVAVDKEYGIGKNGDLLVNIPTDKKHFKKITGNSTVIMGRKTWDSLPQKPLPNRKNVIISNSNNKDFVSMKDAINIITCAKKDEDIFIIGGSQIYKELLKYCDTIYMTKIYGIFGADTFFPKIDNNEWEMKRSSEMNFYDNIPFQFSIYKRRRAI